MPGAPVTPDTTELGRGWRTVEPAAASPGLVADDPSEEASLPDPAGTPTDPRRPEPADEPPEEEPPEESPTDEPPRPPRAAPRDGTDALVDVDDESEGADEPVDPADPVVSANATGTTATTEPTPNATASAPTRPTYAAKPRDAPSVAVTARRLYSIARTRPVDERR